MRGPTEDMGRIDKGERQTPITARWVALVAIMSGEV